VTTYLSFRMTPPPSGTAVFAMTVPTGAFVVADAFGEAAAEEGAAEEGAGLAEPSVAEVGAPGVAVSLADEQPANAAAPPPARAARPAARSIFRRVEPAEVELVSRCSVMA